MAPKAHRRGFPVQQRRLAVRLLACAAAFAGGLAVAAESLTVVSWGGAYGRASRLAVLEPFSAETGIEVKIEDYNGGLAQIRAQVETGIVTWDVVDLEIPDLVRGCDEGLLEEVDVKDLPPAADGTPAATDFLPDTVTDCGATQLFYATIYAYNSKTFPEGEGAEKPTTIADFFDLAKFPGKRGMRRTPQVNLEFALMADGVAQDQVYAVLDTPEGLDRAFRKLDTIKDVIVWWEAGAQPPQLLADQEVAMSTAYNGRVFNAQVLEEQPFVVVWDGQVLDTGGFGIVLGTKNAAAARKLVAYSAQPEVQARISEYISYSPTRRSAAPLVSNHKETGTVMEPHMPTSEENLATALTNDWEWWSDHLDEVNERFAAWLAR